MRRFIGESRSVAKRNHALISPDSHEPITLPGWSGAELSYVIAPQMGARISQYFAELAPGGWGEPARPDIGRFFHVLAGQVDIATEGEPRRLGVGGYGFLPAGVGGRIGSEGGARLVVIEKRFAALSGQHAPTGHFGDEPALPTAPMKGDPDVLLRKLLPETPAWDCEVNTMEFSPGASLPYVETHFMEHGLLMLTGGGIYRLDDDWYPVAEGDSIWMGPFCPQWFGAIGKSPAKYLIYKDFNRDPMADRGPV